MRDRYVDPASADLDAELRFIQSTNKQVRRITMNRGDSCLVRFLPAEMGPKKHWYARIAKHWVNKKPIVCPKLTGPDYGGDPDCFCPVCDLVAELGNSSSEDVRDFAWNARGGLQWTTWCLLLEKSSGRGSEQIPQNELLVPYTFELYRNTFEELSAFYRNNLRASNPHSILDLVRGCDIWASKTAKGIRLDKQDTLPVLEDLPEDPMTDQRIIKIMAQLQTPKVQLPTTEKLEEFADKLHDAATRPSRSSRGGREEPADDEGDERRGRGRSETSYDDDAAAAPRSRGRSRIDEEEDDVPGAEVPAKPQRGAPQREVHQAQEPEQPARRPVSREQAEPQRSRSQPPARQPEAEQNGERDEDLAQDEANDAEVQVHRSVTRTPERQRPAQPRAAEEGRPQRPSPTGQAAQAARAGRPRPESEGKIDDAEEVPEERMDQAPPAARKRVPDVDEETPPAAVNRPGAATVPQDRMRARIQAASQERRPRT